MNKQQSPESKMVMIYDKECPMCDHFACSVDKANYHVQIVNGRENSDLLHKAANQNLNIDTGLIVFHNQQFYHGHQAIGLLANHIELKGLSGLFSRQLLRRPLVARFVYPCLVWIKDCLLWLRGKPLINHQTTADQPLAVYYNSACPVCNAGIQYQQSRVVGGKASWNDIHDNPELVKDLDKNIEQARETLHVINGDRQVKSGIDAFIAIWQVSSSDVWKAKLLSIPIIHGFASIGYRVFARLLYRWNRTVGNW